MSEATTSGREPRLVEAFVDLADTLVEDYDAIEVLHRLVEHCVGLLDAAAAGLLLSDQRGSLRVVASSTEQTRLLELFQLQTDEGPCLEAFSSGEVVNVADLSQSTERWPRFAREAIRESFRSVHAVPLRLRHEVIGALNLFGHEPGGLGQEDARVARALADTATIGILQERALHRSELLTEQLQTALNNRVTIEQAKGVLAHARGIDVAQAFEYLRAYARSRSSRLSVVAHDVVTGAIEPAEILDRHQVS